MNEENHKGIPQKISTPGTQIVYVLLFITNDGANDH